MKRTNLNVVYSIASSLGVGIGYVAYQAIRGLLRHGIPTKVICLSQRQRNGINENMLCLKPLELLGFIPHKNIMYITKDNFFDLISSAFIGNCDVFHGWANQCLFQLLVARHHGAKTIVERGSTHILEQYRILKEEHVRWNIRTEPILQSEIRKMLLEYKIADYIVVPSEFVVKSFKKFGLEKKAIKLPLGVDLEKFKPRKNDHASKSFRVLFVGQLSIRKGVLYLLEAWKRLKLKRAQLILIGLKERAIVPLLKHYRNYIWHPWVPQITTAYNDADVFCLPSLEDGWAMVVCEAMAYGLPVIVTENTGSTEIVEEGKDGFIVPIRNYRALMEKIQYLYDNPDEVKRMGRNARKKAERYSWEEYQRRLVKIYEKHISTR